MDQPIRVAVAQRQLLEKFAQQGDCVIVGRCADVILKDYRPLNLFVYADMDAKVERCMKRAPEGEHLTRSEMEKAIRRIDKERAQNHLMCADTSGAAKEPIICASTPPTGRSSSLSPRWPSSARTGSPPSELSAQRRRFMKIRFNDDPKIVETVRGGAAS